MQYDNFSDLTGLDLYNAATTAETEEGTVLRLNSTDGNNVGAAFSEEKVSAAAFSSHFEFRITEPGNGGADGFTFVLAAGDTGNGSAGYGEGLGYAGLTNSVAIEFDTWQNANESANHIGIDQDGSVTSVASSDVETPMDNGNVWDVWVEYSGGTLSVFLSDDGIKPGTAQLTYAIDLIAVLNTNLVSVGFTASTGGSTEIHDILSFGYTSQWAPLIGDDDGNLLAGDSSADLINGNGGNDTLTGAGNNDTIDGGTGYDVMTGGLGDDVYYVDHVYDLVNELHFEGTDTLYSSVTYSLFGRAVENAYLTGAANLNITGNSLANVLTGNSGNNRIDGAQGADTMSGGAGDDLYTVNAAGDVIIEATNEGLDIVHASVNYTLSDNLEDLTLLTAGNLKGTGNAGNNVLYGNPGNNKLDGAAGNDVLDGSVGQDTLIGGLGNDTYYIHDTAAKVTEVNGEGTDIIYSDVSYNLHGRYIETLELTGIDNIDATGNSVNNILIGNANSNTLNGLGGKDILTGGLGADIFLFQLGAAKDTITDFSASDNDMININGFTGGVANTGLVTQAGLNVLITLNSGNIITINNATTADVLSHIVW
ncbi:rhizobiocin RzcA [Asticcacaulis biprosthecium C19]|uniref:Rhizobiocin RzcA n=1 Tax=Asticcacaulis biprosthecium C19 TaxID=715226 RepID=F4QTU0_9CAUL|nr:rhizobiocin RzcA [Asticcacaulis biprosthecium]EGF89240.1 rhizobiocin RzcA [Asticcacaulis biprosthecium C19]